jgi:integrase
MRRGRLIWSVRYLAPEGRRRYTIGEFPVVGLAAARKATAAARGRAAAGQDPQAEREEAREAARKRRAGETVKGAVTSWLADRKRGPAARWKDGLKGGSARCFLPHVRRLQAALGARRLEEVTARELERFISEPNAAGTRNRRLTAVRTFFEWARRGGLLDGSPVTDLPKEREVERHRVMSDEELRAVVYGFDATRWGRVVRFLTLTGLRRDEALGLRWVWLDLDKGLLTLPPEAEKAGPARGEPRHVPLSREAIAVLRAARAATSAEGVRSGFVFHTSSGARPHRDALKPVVCRLRGLRSNGTAPSKDKRAKSRVAVLPPDVSVHDIRRTVADALLRRVGAEPWVVDHVVLGHVRPKLLRTYMPTLPLEQARAALDQWGNELASILGEQAQKTTGEN